MNSLAYPSFSGTGMRHSVESKKRTTTKSIIKNAVRVFSDFIALKSDLPVKTVDQCYAVTIGELDLVLGRFYDEVRQKNGDIYMKKSLISLRYGLQRHFLSTRNVDIINDTRFRPSNYVFGTVLTRLKQTGKDIIRHKQPITAGDRQKMYDTNVLGNDTPISLQRKVFFEIMFHLCRKGREELHVMKKSDFTISEDSFGTKYVHFSPSYLTKNRLIENRTSRMYELIDNTRCPVKSFLKYTSRLNPRNPNMWQRPKQAVTDDSVTWYLNVNLGHNALGSMMRNTSIAADLSQLYTNQCIRATSNLVDQGTWSKTHEMVNDADDATMTNVDKAGSCKEFIQHHQCYEEKRYTNKMISNQNTLQNSASGHTVSTTMFMKSQTTTASPMASWAMAASPPIMMRTTIPSISPLPMNSQVTTASSRFTRALPMETSGISIGTPVTPEMHMPRSGVEIKSNEATASLMETRSQLTMLLPMETLETSSPIRTRMASNASCNITTSSGADTQVTLADATTLMPTFTLGSSPDISIKEEVAMEMLNTSDCVVDEQFFQNNIRDPRECEVQIVYNETENNPGAENIRVRDEPKECPKIVNVTSLSSTAPAKLVTDEANLIHDVEEYDQTRRGESQDITEEDLCPLKRSNLLLIDDEDDMEGREKSGIKTPFKRLTERHFIAVNKGRTPLGKPSKPYCIVCSNPVVRCHRTEFICEQCILPMCPIPCFKRYHTLKEYKDTCSIKYHNN